MPSNIFVETSNEAVDQEVTSGKSGTTTLENISRMFFTFRTFQCDISDGIFPKRRPLNIISILVAELVSHEANPEGKRVELAYDDRDENMLLKFVIPVVRMLDTSQVVDTSAFEFKSTNMESASTFDPKLHEMLTSVHSEPFIIALISLAESSFQELA